MPLKLVIKKTAGGAPPFSVTVEPEILISELKSEVSQQADIPAEEQRLIYKGQAGAVRMGMMQPCCMYQLCTVCSYNAHSGIAMLQILKDEKTVKDYGATLTGLVHVASLPQRSNLWTSWQMHRHDSSLVICRHRGGPRAASGARAARRQHKVGMPSHHASMCAASCNLSSRATRVIHAAMCVPSQFSSCLGGSRRHSAAGSWRCRWHTRRRHGATLINSSARQDSCQQAMPFAGR